MAGHGVATDTLPSAETQLQVADYPVFDREGKELPFSDVYNGRNATDRTLIVFVRHFFCSVCFFLFFFFISQSHIPKSLALLPSLTP